MTKREILIQALSQANGRSPEDIAEMLEIFAHLNPKAAEALSAEVDDDHAQEIIAKTREHIRKTEADGQDGDILSFLGNRPN